MGHHIGAELRVETQLFAHKFHVWFVGVVMDKTRLLDMAAIPRQLFSQPVVVVVMPNLQRR